MLPSSRAPHHGCAFTALVWPWLDRREVLVFCQMKFGQLFHQIQSAGVDQGRLRAGRQVTKSHNPKALE